MFKCDYCGNILDNKKSNCPKCGGNRFTKIYKYEMNQILEPPKKGYRINSIIKKINMIANIILCSYVIGVIYFIIKIWMFLYNKSFIEENYTFFESLETIPSYINIFNYSFIFLILVITVKILSRKPLKKLKKLSKNGVLFKNLPYKILYKNMNTVIVEVIYENKKGNSFHLNSNLLSKKKSKKYNTVDLLIDKDDMKNYYIDFEIS